MPATRPVRPQDGAAGIANEADRLSRLTAAGLRVPAVLERGDHWLLMSDLGQTTLDSLIRGADSVVWMAYWKQGADYIQRVRRAGQ